jgi:hypothetical protein
VTTAKPGRRRSRTAATWAATLLAVAPLSGAQEIPIASISSRMAASSPIRTTTDGIVTPVDGWEWLSLPLPGVEELQIDYVASGRLMLSWTSAIGATALAPHTSPWHHEVLPPGPGRLTLEMRTTPNWSPERVPLLFVEGTGTFVLAGLRARSPLRDPASRRASFDEAARWAPIRVDHTTINGIVPPFWSASRGLALQRVLGIVFAALALGGGLAWWLWKRRWRPGPAIALSAVLLAVAGDLVFAARVSPALSIVPEFLPEARLREWTRFDPELGPLAALARTAIRPDERVGVQVRGGNWFFWETICFQLAPRPCVLVVPGANEFSGLQGVDRLRYDQLDALVVFHPDAPLPAGFVPATLLDKNAFVARRR